VVPSPAVTGSPHPAVALYERHVNPAFVRLLGVLGYGRVMTRAQGVWLWDHEGRRYLDALAGFGSVNLGHNHPRLLARLADVLRAEALHFCHTGPAVGAAELGAALAARLAPPLEIALLSSSGADAVEAGIKLARAATRRHDVIYCEGGFHGTSLGTLSIMGAPRMRGPFEPLFPGFRAIPFGQLAPLERALAGRRAAAFVVEPLQAEAGVILPPPGYLAEAQALCRRAGTVLVLDEVQTGLGRTGTRWAYQREGFTPDVIVLAKALSGGVMPVAATVTSRELHERAYGALDRFDLHSSTFGGGALACAAALETLAIVDDEKLPERAAAGGERLLGGVRRALTGHPLVKAVRGRGLLVAIELGGAAGGLRGLVVDRLSERLLGQWVAVKLLERGVVCQPASHAWNVLKLEPPLTIADEQIDELVAAVAAALEDCRDVARTLAEVALRVGKQWRQGWAF